MSASSPVVSVGLAVRNGTDSVRRCIDSVLSQDFGDLELVVCDNVSDDGTIDVLKRYADMDKRVRLNLNPVNIGLHENMKRVLELSRGTFFRWISADDWLEPGYISQCVRALEDCPEAIGVTTSFTIHMADGSSRYEEYAGKFPSGSDPVRRFALMLRFFHAGDAKYDPIYGMYRRDRLMRCHPLRPSERTDWLLSAELALAGPIIHVPKRLANRTRSYPVGIDRAAFRRRLDPVRAEQIRTSATRLARQLFALAVMADLSDAQLRGCRLSTLRFWAKELVSSSRSRLSDVRHRLLPGSRAARFVDATKP